jgi:hypothetical protein
MSRTSPVDQNYNPCNRSSSPVAILNHKQFTPAIQLAEPLSFVISSIFGVTQDLNGAMYGLFASLDVSSLVPQFSYS